MPETTEPETDQTEPETSEVVTGELVDRSQPATQDVEPVEEHRTAIEVAAQAMLDSPGTPGRDEFLSLAAQARMLHMSGAAPKPIRDDVYVAFHVAMVGRDLGISPSAAVALIDVLWTGNGPQLALSPQLLNGQIRRLGLGSIVPAIRERDRAVAVVLGPGGRLDSRCRETWPHHWPTIEARREAHEMGMDVPVCSCSDVLGDYEFTWEDARDAGLVGRECEPGNHSAACRAKTRGDSCNQGYKTYPKRMMWWRAAGFAADDYFPEAGLGLYSPEELGAVVDEEGRPIDPSTIELPPGYEQAEQTQAPDPNEPAPADDVKALQERIDRIKGIPDAAKALAALWTQRNENDVPRLNPLAKLWKRELPVATALVKSIETRIEKGEWGDVSGPESDPGAETAETTQEPAEAQEEPVSAESEQNPGSEPEQPLDPRLVALAEQVKGMRIADVVLDLGKRNLPVEGNEQAQRMRLTEALYREPAAEPSDPVAEPEQPDLRPLQERLLEMSKRELTAACVVHFVHSTGTKPELIDRLDQYLTEQGWEPGDPIIPTPETIGTDPRSQS